MAGWLDGLEGLERLERLAGYTDWLAGSGSPKSKAIWLFTVIWFALGPTSNQTLAGWLAGSGSPKSKAIWLFTVIWFAPGPTSNQTMTGWLAQGAPEGRQYRYLR